MTIVPIDSIDRRPPEAGRIRTGQKTGKAMKALDVFRFTSPHRDAIEQLAQQYGGVVEPWNDPSARIANQFEVVTTTSSIEIMLPDEALSCWYELWSGGGCVRRCDGNQATVTVSSGPDGDAQEQLVPCICQRNALAECRPYTRLNVVLPNVNFYGYWRLESKGWNAMKELPGMTDLISYMASKGTMVRSLLSLQQRTSMHNGRKRHFIVPQLGMIHTPAELMSGDATARPQLSQNEPLRELTSTPIYDEDIVEAVVVEDIDDELAVDLHAIAVQYELDPDAFIAHVVRETDGNSDKLRAMMTRVRAGKIEPTMTLGVVGWRVL